MPSELNSVDAPNRNGAEKASSLATEAIESLRFTFEAVRFELEEGLRSPDEYSDETRPYAQLVESRMPLRNRGKENGPSRPPRLRCPRRRDYSPPGGRWRRIEKITDWRDLARLPENRMNGHEKLVDRRRHINDEDEEDSEDNSVNEIEDAIDDIRQERRRARRRLTRYFVETIEKSDERVDYTSVASISRSSMLVWSNDSS